MPKERRDRSVSIDSCRGSPFSCSSSRVKSRSSPKNIKDSDENVKEWDDARCPVCMEHPHNAVLLLCSSHEKGCRPFMCDTSYRHSNCLDQFRKSFSDASILVSHQEEVAVEPATALVETAAPDTEAVTENLTVASAEVSTPRHAIPCENPTKPALVCPLCRGKITGWIVVEPARHFMNAKHRSCACETCDFSGAYSDLRKHARVSHPLVRPSEADPERQRSWRRLERQRDLGDLLSTLQSSIGEEGDEESILPVDDGSWLTVFFLIRVFRPGSTTRSSSWSGASRARAQQSVRRRLTRLWGESYDNTENNTPASRDDDNESSDGGSGGPWRRRTRRRTTPDEQQ
uniref:Zinc finger, RING/FYVE/PHD-type n=1 Tax=Kalanchoe fedtschenkoi TaxID=63787 RepID=A0A7N0U4C2_KALFE